MSRPNTPLLSVDNLVVRYKARSRSSEAAVRGVTFSVGAGETVGLVGESGSGKSSIGKAILGLVKPESGSVRLQGKEIANPSRSMRASLAQDLQVVFQDPNSSLNPTRTVGSSLMEPLLVRKKHSLNEARERARRRLADVGMPADAMDRYPSAFSGGQRQRIAIARALVMEPKLIVCDEPVSALDLSVQAQVLNLMVDLQVSRGLSYLFITHDLSVVRHMSHHVLVLQQGTVVEEGSGDKLWNAPSHPYTRALIDSIPEPNPEKRLRARAIEA